MKATDLITGAALHAKAGVTLCTQKEIDTLTKDKKPVVTVKMDFNGMLWGQVCSKMERGVIVPLQTAFNNMDEADALAFRNSLPTDEKGNHILTVKAKDATSAWFDRPKTREEKLADGEQVAEDMNAEELAAYIARLQEKMKVKKAKK